MNPSEVADSLYSIVPFASGGRVGHKMPVYRVKSKILVHKHKWFWLTNECIVPSHSKFAHSKPHLNKLDLCHPKIRL